MSVVANYLRGVNCKTKFQFVKVNVGYGGFSKN